VLPLVEVAVETREDAAEEEEGIIITMLEEGLTTPEEGVAGGGAVVRGTHQKFMASLPFITILTPNEFHESQLF
jgi:hypothetical protein